MVKNWLVGHNQPCVCSWLCLEQGMCLTVSSLPTGYQFAAVSLERTGSGCQELRPLGIYLDWNTSYRLFSDVTVNDFIYFVLHFDVFI